MVLLPGVVDHAWPLCSVPSDSLQPHELQHATLPCPSLSPEFPQTHVHQVGDAIQHLIFSHPFLLLPSILPRIRVFSNELALFIKWPKYWSFSFSISLPMNIQDWFPLGLTSLISLLSKGLSRVFFSITVWKHQFFGTQPSLWSNCYIISLEKP